MGRCTAAYRRTGYAILKPHTIERDIDYCIAGCVGSDIVTSDVRSGRRIDDNTVFPTGHNIAISCCRTTDGRVVAVACHNRRRGFFTGYISTTGIKSTEKVPGYGDVVSAAIDIDRRGHISNNQSTCLGTVSVGPNR